MGIVVTAIESAEQWHALRKPLIGASEAAALVGVHEYLTYYGLWARKSGRLPPVEDNAAMERGRRLEQVAVDVTRDRHPELDLIVPRAHYADQQFGLGATPDLLADDRERGRGVIQIKSVAPSVFRRAWRGDSDVVTPPIWIAIQAMMEAELTGVSWAAVAALVIDHEIDLHLVEVPIHRDIIETIRNEALEFWKGVLSGREPDPDYKRDGEAIRAMLKQDDGSEIDLSGDNEIHDLVDRRDQAAELARHYDADAKEISAALLHKLGTASVGYFNGGYISAKTINRAAYQVKASSYRQLRVVRDKEA